MPILVHVATNDLDVNYVEDQQLVWKLRALKPDLAETKIYVDPPTWGSLGGHAFSRRVDPITLERVDSPEQIDSWNRRGCSSSGGCVRIWIEAKAPTTSQ